MTIRGISRYRGRLFVFCLSDDKFRKPWRVSFSLIRYISTEYGSRSYEGHRVKVNVMETKNVSNRSHSRTVKLPSSLEERKKVCYEVSLCENCQRQSCQAFIGLTIHAKMIAGATPSTWNIGSNWPRWSEIADFRSIFALSAISCNMHYRKKV